MKSDFETDEAERELYSRGFCHAFAMASVRRDGGSFLVVTDSEEVAFYDENVDPIFVVMHVYALHEQDGLVIARDVFGERPENEVLREIQSWISGSPLEDDLPNEETFREIYIDENEETMKPLAEVSEEMIDHATEVLERVCPRALTPAGP